MFTNNRDNGETVFNYKWVYSSGLNFILKFSIYNFFRLFNALSDANINIILITQASSEQSISFATASENAQRAKEIVDAKFQ
ncbi:MAG: ACT domain-containing protein, partial [Bacteroidota bacterium]